MIVSKLSQILRRKKLKLIDVIRATGITRPTLTSLYYGKGTGINFDTMDKLCRFLNVTPGELLVWRGKTPSVQNLENKYKVILHYKMVVDTTAHNEDNALEKAFDAIDDALDGCDEDVSVLRAWYDNVERMGKALDITEDE